MVFFKGVMGSHDEEARAFFEGSKVDYIKQTRSGNQYAQEINNRKAKIKSPSMLR